MILHACVLALAVLHPGRSPDDPAARRQSLVDWVNACDRVVEAKIVAVRPMTVRTQGPHNEEVRLAELRVLRVVWGRACGETLLVTLGRIDQEPAEATPGSRAIWFLARARWFFPVGQEAMEWLHKRVERFDVQEVVGDGSAVLFEEVNGAERLVLVREGTLRSPPDLIAPVEVLDPSGRRTTPVRLAAFESWIGEALQRDTPRISVELSGNGSCYPSLRIEPQGRCFYRGCRSDSVEREITLTTEEIQRLQSLVQTPEFERLPTIVGYWCCPDSTFCAVEIRRPSGIQRVNIFDRFAPGSSTTEERRAFDCVSTFLASLPAVWEWRPPSR